MLSISVGEKNLIVVLGPASPSSMLRNTISDLNENIVAVATVGFRKGAILHINTETAADPATSNLFFLLNSAENTSRKLQNMFIGERPPSEGRRGISKIACHR